MTASLGLLGLGNMGLAVAGRLSTAFSVHAYDPDPARCALAAENGVHVAGSQEEVAERARTVVLSLPRPSISYEAVRLLTGAWGTGGAIVETSTVTPSDVRTAVGICTDHSALYIDAAILSGVASVQNATTTLLIGGDAAAIAQLRPVLDAITPNQLHLGEAGAGMAAKVINNAVAHAVYVLLAEAAAIGAANGIDIPTLVNLLSGPEAGLLRPLTHRIGERLHEHNFDGGMSVEAARKDSVLALQLAQSDGIPLFTIQAAHAAYEIAVAQGLARSDYSAVATLWEAWSGTR